MYMKCLLLQQWLQAHNTAIPLWRDMLAALRRIHAWENPAETGDAAVDAIYMDVRRLRFYKDSWTVVWELERLLADYDNGVPSDDLASLYGLRVYEGCLPRDGGRCVDYGGGARFRLGDGSEWETVTTAATGTPMYRRENGTCRFVCVTPPAVAENARPQVAWSWGPYSVDLGGGPEAVRILFGDHGKMRLARERDGLAGLVRELGGPEGLSEEAAHGFFAAGTPRFAVPPGFYGECAPAPVAPVDERFSDPDRQFGYGLDDCIIHGRYSVDLGDGREVVWMVRGSGDRVRLARERDGLAGLVRELGGNAELSETDALAWLGTNQHECCFRVQPGFFAQSVALKRKAA